MTTETVVTLIVAILGSSVVGSVLTLWFTRRKIAAEAKQANSTATVQDVDALAKFSDMLKDLQTRNAELYTENVELQKGSVEKDRTNEVLIDRLNLRDSQISAATKQLESLRNLAEKSPITEALREQSEALTPIIAKLQSAQSDGSRLVLESEKTISELYRTNRDLEMKKPPKI